MLSSLWTAIGFYSIIPAPKTQWSEESTRFSICFLPLIGVFLGGALYLWRALCVSAQINAQLFAAVAAALPLILTGGLHMDGFMDTADAIASRQSRQRKLEIMRDSHVGAFAVMSCAIYMLLCFALYCAVYELGDVTVICIGFVLSRALCATSALRIKNARGNGALYEFTRSKTTRAVIITLAVVALCVCGMVYFGRLRGALSVAFAAAAFFIYLKAANRLFGGLTGDTCGFFIQLCELTVLAGALIGSYI